MPTTSENEFDPAIEIINRDKWRCPRCKAVHRIQNSYSMDPRNCENCKFKVWITAHYIELDGGYKKLVITSAKIYKPKKWRNGRWVISEQ